MSEERAAAAVDKAISELIGFDLVVVDEPPEEESDYVARHRHEYIRTVRDILKHRPPENGPVRVLEIGAFFGVVCMALADLGYAVTAADIPEYIELPAQVERFARHGIATRGVRLEDFILPFDDETFDVVVMCEVLEHLNFNPLPLLKEINRIGKPGSVFYLSLPNMASIYNRKALATGHSIGVGIDAFFKQLDGRSSEIANGHWREYTAPEIREMLEQLGYRIGDQYYFSLGETLPIRSMKSRVAQLIYARFPFFKENQTTIAFRDQRTQLRFRIPQTVHRTLHEL
jgi:SAM-dependent methyltransferase